MEQTKKKSSEIQVSLEVAQAIYKNHAPIPKSTQAPEKEEKKHEIHTDVWKAMVRKDALKLAKGKKLPKK